MSERRRWTRLGERNPYWAVLVDEHYRANRIGDAELQAFFASGEQELSRTLATIRRVLSPDFAPGNALDYGCGVGRLVIPMAAICERVVGVDISQPMLDEAERNCARRSIANAAFMTADAFLAAEDSSFAFDFIHSTIVFQHIEPSHGLKILERLLSRLLPGGVAALHFTYARDASRARRLIHRLRWRFPPVNIVVNVVQRRPPLEPMTPMHEYDLAEVFRVFEAHGCRRLFADLTDHGGHKGVMLTFVRER